MSFFELMEGYTPVWRHFPHQLVAPSVSVYDYMLSSFLSVAAGGVVCHGFDSLLLVSQEPCEFRILVDRLVFPTNPPPGVQGGGYYL